jgi:regulator of sigma E protease
LTLVDGGIEREVELSRSVSGEGDLTAKRLVGWGIGIFQPSVIGTVVAGGPAAAAGLLANDRIVAVDGKRVNEWGELTELIRAAPGRHLELDVVRGTSSVPIKISVQPKPFAANGTTIGRIDVTPVKLLANSDADLSTNKRGIVAASIEGVHRTIEATTLTGRVLWGMVTGEVSLRQVSGPLSMAEGAGATLKQGSTAFLLFLAIVSISIGVLNLLPVPMLDGGQLLYHLYEAIKGSPPSERALIFGQRIGIGFVSSLTALALYNDFHRIFS